MSDDDNDIHYVNPKSINSAKRILDKSPVMKFANSTSAKKIFEMNEKLQKSVAPFAKMAKQHSGLIS